MNRPTVEVADILRALGNRFIEQHRGWLRFQQLKVMRAISRCRTAALGGHIDKCLRCGKDWGLSFNSCRDRHCPKCQAQSRQRWIEARQEELLASSYFHVVFTLPHLLNALIRQNPEELYNLLFRSVAEAFGPAALGVVLTGMGSDGVRGSERIMAAGGRVIVQDEATSVVWGMPGQVAAAGCADGVYPLREMAEEIERRVEASRETRTSNLAPAGRA